MVRGIIYMYTSPSGKSYIGQTTDEKKRRSSWFSSNYEYAGDKINRARAKYGRDSFLYEVLFSHLYKSKKEAIQMLDTLEIFYIGLYDTVNNGYNCDKGGHSHVEYKLSEENKTNIGKGSKKWQSTPEGRAKMSAARKGLKKKRGYRIESNFKPVIQLTLKGEYIQEFPSVKDASMSFSEEKAHSYATNISGVCKGNRDSVGGYKWLYKEDYYNYFLCPDKKDVPNRVKRALDSITNIATPKIKKKYKKKPKLHKEGPRINKFAQQIGQYNLNCGLVKVWRCAKEAADVLCIKCENIHRATRTLGKYMGFYWRKYNGELTILPKPKKQFKRPNLYKKVVQKDLHDNIIAIHDSIQDACNSLNIVNRTCISKCLNGKAHTAYGFKWEFLKCS